MYKAKQAAYGECAQMLKVMDLRVGLPGMAEAARILLFIAILLPTLPFLSFPSVSLPNRPLSPSFPSLLLSSHSSYD